MTVYRFIHIVCIGDKCLWLIDWLIDWFHAAVYNDDTLCVGFARLGSESQMIVAGTMKQLRSIDFGSPLHCLVIVGKTHPVEEEMLDFYKSGTENLEQDVVNVAV